MDKNEENNNIKQKETLEKLENMRAKALNKEECKMIAQKLTQYIMQNKK